MLALHCGEVRSTKWPMSIGESAPMIRMHFAGLRRSIVQEVSLVKLLKCGASLYVLFVR
jgi:hypothetical protein